MLDLDVSQIIIQIIAFLVMFWVMKRFGWQPLLDILEARRQKIATEFQEIAAQKQEIEALSSRYEERLAEIGAQARKKIQDAVAEGQKISGEIQEEAKAKAKDILIQAQEAIKVEILETKNALKNDIVNLVITAAEKMLQTTLDEKSQKELVVKLVEESKRP